MSYKQKNVTKVQNGVQGKWYILEFWKFDIRNTTQKLNTAKEPQTIAAVSQLVQSN